MAIQPHAAITPVSWQRPQPLELVSSLSPTQLSGSGDTEPALGHSTSWEKQSSLQGFLGNPLHSLPQLEAQRYLRTKVNPPPRGGYI